MLIVHDVETLHLVRWLQNNLTYIHMLSKWIISL
jgi:hypothetical protein